MHYADSVIAEDRDAPKGTKQLYRIAVIGVSVIACIVILGGVALENATAWIQHTRSVLRLAAHAHSQLMDARVDRLLALARADSAPTMVSAPLTPTVDSSHEIVLDSLLLLTRDNSEQQARVRAVRSASSAVSTAWSKLALSVGEDALAPLVAARAAERAAFNEFREAEQALYSERLRRLRSWRLIMILTLLGTLGAVWVVLRRFVQTTDRQAEMVSVARGVSTRASTRLEHVLNNSPVALAIVDSKNRVELANPAWATVAGVEEEAVVGTHLSHGTSQVGGRLLELVKEVRDSGIAKSEEFIEESSAVPQSAAPTRAWTGTIYPIADSERHLNSVGIALLDISNSRHLQAQLRQSQRIESIGMLAGGIAHDFNNILTAITGFTEMAIAATPADARIQRDLAQVRRAADRASMLTRQLLTFSRQQVVRPTVLDLNVVLQDMTVMLKRLIGSHITLEVEPVSQVWPIFADAGSIEQVLMNLVVNARDAMPDGGVLTISTQNVSRADGSVVELRVQDTGVGMPADVRERIFEPFFTTKAVGRGTGLGLATVYGIVTQANGTIEVESTLGRGTLFTVRIPRAKQIESTTPTSVRTTEAASVRGSILVAEDDADIRQLAQYVLESNGHHVVVVTNGADALQAVAAQQPPFDLLITDLVMPQLGGRELSKQLAAQGISMPVLFISGYAPDDRNRLTVLPERARFLEKPFTPARLLEEVQQALSGG